MFLGTSTIDKLLSSTSNMVSKRARSKDNVERNALDVVEQFPMEFLFNAET